MVDKKIAELTDFPYDDGITPDLEGKLVEFKEVEDHKKSNAKYTGSCIKDTDVAHGKGKKVW